MKGVTDGRLRAAVRSGDLVRQGSVYALPDAASEVIVAAELGGRLTCSSAASRLGLDTLHPPDQVHVAVPRNCPRSDERAIVHRTGNGKGWLVIEIDGYAHHSSRDQFRNDRRRANLLAEKGMVLLRFSYEDVMFRSEQMVALIRYVLATR